MIKGTAHICIASRDLRASERFYCEGLGYVKAFDFIRDGKVFGFYLKAPDASFIEVFHQEAAPETENCAIRHICLETEDLEALAAHLTALGYECTPRRLGADRSLQMWTSDPTGVRIEFHQYTPESSQLTGENCVID